MRSTEELLQEGAAAGQFGGDLEPHGEHAMGFLSFSGDLSGHVVDLGSGAGLPALILIEARPHTTWTLIERRRGRVDLLRRAVRRLGFQPASTMQDALEMAADVVGPRPTITHLHNPHIVMADVT